MARGAILRGLIEADCQHESMTDVHCTGIFGRQGSVRMTFGETETP